MKLPRVHKWIHKNQTALFRKLQYCFAFPEHLRNNYWLLMIIVDYSRENYGEFPTSKLVDKLNLGSYLGSNYVTGIIELDSDETFWKLALANCDDYDSIRKSYFPIVGDDESDNDNKDNDDNKNSKILFHKLEVIKWIQLPKDQKSEVYYLDDDYIVRPDEFINNRQGKIVYTNHILYSGCYDMWFVPNRPNPNVRVFLSSKAEASDIQSDSKSKSAKRNKHSKSKSAKRNKHIKNGQKKYK